MYNQDQKKSMIESALWVGVKESKDAQAIMTDTWVQSTNRSAPAAFLNGVHRCELDTDSIDEKIKTTIKHYRDLKIPFRWKVTESSRPKDLAERLKKNGLIHKETIFGLFADPKDLKISTDSKVQIERLDLDRLEDWLVVQRRAWGVPAQGIEFMRNKMKNDLTEGKGPYLNFLAYDHGKPVGSAALRYYSDFAFLQGAAVDPDFRKKGIYKSLLKYRCDLIQKKGLPVAIHCLENTSAPICMKLGFEKVVEIQIFEDQP